ncbi:MAG: hypothetical protein AAGF95_13510 [Chloroflexota bacterium]
MSKLFAFNVSQTTEEFEVDGRYDQASQLWIGNQEAQALIPAGISCKPSWVQCEDSRSASPCSTTGCWPATNGYWCHAYYC